MKKRLSKINFSIVFFSQFFLYLCCLIVSLVFTFLFLFGIFSKNDDNLFSEFIKEYGSEYNQNIETLRLTQTQHLTKMNYLDYMGAGVYLERQIEKSNELFTMNMHGNPHSLNPSSSLSRDLVENVRNRILKYFCTDRNEYTVIFTSGATASLKLVGETFPWEKNKSTFAYTKINHNSVLGIRRLTTMKGGKFISLEDEDAVNMYSLKEKPKGLSLFTYPAQSNFGGRKYPLEWLYHFKNESPKWYVLLDAAGFVPTNKLSLKKYPFDFVALSFYKMFGYPTGLGVLLVKNDAFSILEKQYFGGGAVEVVSCDDEKCTFKEDFQKFEDGTINFQSIIALNKGFDEFEKIGIQNINNHINSLITYLYKKMEELKYENGEKVVEIYGNHDKNDKSKQGGVLSFSVKDRNGNYIGHHDIVIRASKYNIHVRGGIHCNPGGAEVYFGVTYDELTEANEKNLDVINGKPTGVARVSIGWLTTWNDINIFLEWMKNEFILNQSCEKEVCLDLFPNNYYNSFKFIIWIVVDFFIIVFLIFWFICIIYIIMKKKNVMVLSKIRKTRERKNEKMNEKYSPLEDVHDEEDDKKLLIN